MKALRTLQSPERARKVWHLCTFSTLLAHPSFPGQKRLKGELPTWAELHHANILPLYGVHISRTLAPKCSPWLCRDSHGSRSPSLYGEWAITRGKTRCRFKFPRYHLGRKTDIYFATSKKTLTQIRTIWWVCRKSREKVDPYLSQSSYAVPQLAWLTSTREVLYTGVVSSTEA